MKENALSEWTRGEKQLFHTMAHASLSHFSVSLTNLQSFSPHSSHQPPSKILRHAKHSQMKTNDETQSYRISRGDCYKWSSSCMLHTFPFRWEPVSHISLFPTTSARNYHMIAITGLSVACYIHFWCRDQFLPRTNFTHGSFSNNLCKKIPYDHYKWSFFCMLHTFLTNFCKEYVSCSVFCCTILCK